MNKAELRDLVENTDSRTLSRIIEDGKRHPGNKKERRKIRIVSLFSMLTLFLLLFGGLAGCPRYNVYRSEMSGKAEMKKAEENRKIQIEEAKANLESQRLNAQSEVVRAKGMAEAIEIENGKLTDQYIHYLWVRNIDKMDGEKIYIPTEANMPILEAKNK